MKFSMFLDFNRRGFWHGTICLVCNIRKEVCGVLSSFFFLLYVDYDQRVMIVEKYDIIS
jgi:hypothetical protein